MKKIKAGKYSYKGKIIEKRRLGGMDPRTSLSAYGWFVGSRYCGQLRAYAKEYIDGISQDEEVE
jgi:hypothetical protein